MDTRQFDGVEYFVEATSFEKFCLWKQNEEYKKDFTLKSFQEWDMGTGQMVEIGRLDRRPVAVVFWFDKLDGHKVCFYEATSEVVDHKMVEKWIEDNCNVPVRDGRRAKTDAQNFHNVYHAFKS